MLVEVTERKKSKDPKLVVLHFCLQENLSASVVRMYNKLLSANKSSS